MNTFFNGRQLLAAAFVLILLPFIGRAQEPLDAPVAAWDFDSESGISLRLRGDVTRDLAGPRPPRFPDFAANNTALKFDGKGYFTLEDPGSASDFDFDVGDEITLEAWLRIDTARPGQLMYVVSKGRTGSSMFAPDNQNWALRVTTQGQAVKASFLFATHVAPDNPRDGSQWHRWTTMDGFPVGPDWHHIAVAYKFGVPKSIKGWIDGKPSTGRWDMGGPTDKAPVVDDDDIWIGSSQGGNSGNSFKGWMDGIRIHRRVINDNMMATRFKRIGGPKIAAPQRVVMPDVGPIESGKIVVTLSEKMPSETRWLNQGDPEPKEVLRWNAEHFLFPRIPHRYDDWGIRDAWKTPILARMAADVDLPAGKRTFIVRVRGISRLWVDGELICETKAAKRRNGNEVPIVPVPAPVVPGARLLPFPQQEAIQTTVLPKLPFGKKRRVVLEYMIGGNKLRTESGEVLIAHRTDTDDFPKVLSCVEHDSLPLSDSAIDAELKRIEKQLTRLDDSVRRAAAQSRDDDWQQRHATARNFASKELNPESTDGHVVDHFIDRKIDSASNTNAGKIQASASHFQSDVLPILQENCIRCHGDKAKGGLRLNSRSAALAAGESELAAVVPGDPENSELMVQIRDGAMPPTGDGLNDDQIKILDQWIRDGASWSKPSTGHPVEKTRPISDAAFIRRASLDVTGVIPTSGQVRSFVLDQSPNKRHTLIDELLSDPQYADHWVSMWMDLLAENPSLVNRPLNSTGPFRWFLYESLRDNKSVDRMVTELVMMRGSDSHGGSAGFGIAGENDSPMAAKAHILASAFLGIELQCARCHDSPYHSTTQEDLYSLAAMLGRKQLAPPKTSRVPDAFFEGITDRKSLISVTLRPGVKVEPKWPFSEATGIDDSGALDHWLVDNNDSRERLAFLVTAPQNSRFPKVVVNRLFKRLIGTGLVEPAGDWEGNPPSHPELLDALAAHLVRHNYDLKSVLRLIMTSDLYARSASEQPAHAAPEKRFFVGPDQRRMTAEQVVDSLFVATGREMDSEEITFVRDGATPMSKHVSLGKPTRGWMFSGLQNERDRPSLSLPKAQSVVNVLEAFGWTGTRQQPIGSRSDEATVLQPGILAGGTLSNSLIRAAHESELADLAVEAESPDSLLESLFLRFLSRRPTAAEQADLLPVIASDFEQRLVPLTQVVTPKTDPPLPVSTWTNHLLPQANDIQLEWKARVRRGPPADPRLRTEWRESYEDVAWTLINHREFVWLP